MARGRIALATLWGMFMSRILLALGVVITTVFSTVSAEQPDAPDYYPLVKGNKWEYVAEAGDMKVDVTVMVKDVKSVDGKTVAMLTFTDPKETTERRIESDSGSIRGSFMFDAAPDPPSILLKYPVKPGDKW